VFAGKLGVVVYCGGVGMAADSVVAETAHSFVDVLNQAFLVIGIRRSQKPPSKTLPYGTAREIYTWSLLSCVVLFLSGSCFSIYTGASSLLWPHPVVLDGGGADMMFSPGGPGPPGAVKCP
jgi:divalent metal cation (Fe/Co/Zn/Cd) transporter